MGLDDENAKDRRKLTVKIMKKIKTDCLDC